ncbi:E3 ubiquitin-protein ligase pellino homolog 1-like [Dendronephthya gigantea]|uniref:E3 ubiquitin-protein ligase pellino homolog 1-like n=1 Tax=Dendronephthya gigantea TaxID=151771 RepID=UPI00106CFE3F|nr:E3 ubiquitin-protein ligase pellino homolog 1-like [Dendronephthya gigantea]
MNDLSDSPITYGQLIVLGFNGRIPFETGDARLASKFLVRQRESGNAQKPCKQYSYKSVRQSVDYISQDIHSVCYTVSENENLVVTYEALPNVDMFQIGRSSDINDYVVMDVVPNAQKATDCMLPKSTISRFACRIYVDRSPPYTARIYAAGFDKSKNICLGSKAIKWCKEDVGMMDGLTTNGVLILHPLSGQHGVVDRGPGLWREVSITGDIYALRRARSDRGAGKKVANESNVLVDGTLIDLCGAILLWRSREGIANMPSLRDIEDMRQKLNATKPQCPVGLTTLEFPSNPTKQSNRTRSKTPHVYVKCGHVHGFHTWNSSMFEGEERTCPMCRQVGPYTKLQLGVEAALWADCRPEYYAFVPCGHMCSEATVRFWSQVPLPHGCHAFRAACPFCGTPLQDDVDGFVRLIFS